MEEQIQLIHKQQQNIIILGEQQQQEIINLHKKLAIQQLSFQRKKSLSARPELEEITRKKLLSPKARKFYEKMLRLKKAKRRLTKVVSQMKRDNKSQIVTLDPTNKKNKKKVDKTTCVQQQFINMLLRNSNVAPQVQNSLTIN